jgi:hypothetical protein
MLGSMYNTSYPPQFNHQMTQNAQIINKQHPILQYPCYTPLHLQQSISSNISQFNQHLATSSQPISSTINVAQQHNAQNIAMPMDRENGENFIQVNRKKKKAKIDQAPTLTPSPSPL